MTEALWPGPYGQEAVRAFRRAIEGGMTGLRSLVVGSVASFRDCWMFQRELAKRLGCSVRTVQRGLREARQLGLIECHRSKQHEKAPGLDKEVPCGWSHRWAVGWGLANEKVALAVNVARAKMAIPGLFRRSRKVKQPESRPKRWTADEIETELARRQTPRPPE
jgi:DNA-binding Lrp family transcriptional regulator